MNRRAAHARARRSHVARSEAEALGWMLTAHAPCGALKEFRPWFTDTMKEGAGGPPFLPMPKNAFALWLVNDPQKTIANTSARHRANMISDSVTKTNNPPC